MAKSIFGRKRDLVYLVYFVIHLPVMFLVDLTTLYPSSFNPYVPSISSTLLAYQTEHYQDLFFVSPPRWFIFYTWLELVFHVPVSAWSLLGLWKDDPKVPLVLLVYALETSITTATCIVEYTTWQIEAQAKWDLTGLYGPYLGVSLFMLTDMFIRLWSMLDRKSQIQDQRKLAETALKRKEM